MSLQIAAQHLASKGRGPDSMLVHMAPQEVAGLAALAKANGTSLTINPQTGLPEAFKLKDLLPTIIGFGISALTGGAVQPWMIGLGVGGVEAARTGSLQKGFMAGLGAYGGAGLGASVMGAGTSALQAANNLPAATTTAPVATAVAPQAAAPAMTTLENMVTGANPVTTVAAPSAAAAGDVAIQAAAPKTTTLAPVIDRSIYPAGETASTGLKSLVKDPSPLMNKQNLGYALAALSSMSGAEQSTAAPYKGTQPTYESVYDPETGRFIRVPVGTRAKQESTTGFFKPNMRVAGSEGVRAAAAGGTIEDMSSRNHMEMLLANGGQSFAAGGDTTGMRRVFDPMTGLVTYEPDPSYTPVKTVTKMPQMPGRYVDPGFDGGEGPTPANPANALTGPNGSLNAVAQTLSNLGQSLGITGPGQGYSVLGLPGAIIGNAVAMDPTNPSSVNAQNGMDV
jgi:hypothetical protein